MLISNIKQIPWKSWVDHGKIPPEINALIGVVGELIVLDTKRVARLTLLTLNHVEPVYEYIYSILRKENCQIIDFIAHKSNLLDLRKYLSHEYLPVLPSLVRSEMKLLLMLLKAVESSVLNAFNILSNHVLMCFDSIRRVNASFVNSKMMELVMQWSDVVLLDKQNGKPYIYAMAKEFAKTAIDTGYELINVDADLNPVIGNDMIINKAWLFGNFSWIGHVIESFVRAAPLWLESFFSVALVFFNVWYSDLLLGIHREVLETGTRPNVPLDHLNRLKSLNLSGMKDLEDERDAIVNLADSFLNNVNVSYSQDIDDTKFAAQIVSTILETGQLEISQLNTLFERRIGLSAKTFLSLSDLINDLIDVEGYRIYSAYTSRVKVELVDGGIEGEDVLPAKPTGDPRMAQTQQEEDDEAEDTRIILRNNPRELRDRIGEVSSELNRLAQKYVEFEVSVKDQVEQMRVNMLTTNVQEIAKIDENTASLLATISSPVYDTKLVTRLLFIKKYELRLEWYSKRITRLKFAVESTGITKRWSDFVYTLLIFIAFPVLVAIIMNYGDYLKIVHSLVPQVKPTTETVFPSVSWNTEAWNPVIQHLRGFMEYTGILPREEFVLPCLPEDAPGIATRITGLAVSKISGIISQYTPGIVQQTAVASKNLATDLISETVRTDQGILFTHLRQMCDVSGIFQMGQLLTYFVEDFGYFVLPFIPIWNTVHTLVSYTHNSWTDVDQPRPIVFAYKLWNQNKIFLPLSLSAMYLPPFIRLLILSIGRGMALTSVAGGTALLGPLLGTVAVTKITNSLIASYGKRSKDIENVDFAKEQLEELARFTQKIDSSLLGNTAQTIKETLNLEFSDAQKKRSQVQTQLELYNRMQIIYQTVIPDANINTLKKILFTPSQQDEFDKSSEKQLLLTGTEANVFGVNDDDKPAEELMSREAFLEAYFKMEEDMPPDDDSE